MSDNRLVINGMCFIHSGTRGYFDLTVTKDGDDLVLDPYTTGACVSHLDKAAARELHIRIGEMLG